MASPRQVTNTRGKAWREVIRCVGSIGRNTAFGWKKIDEQTNRTEDLRNGPQEW